jgi:hypothetical protein
MVEVDLELYRATADQAIMARARTNGTYAFDTWKNNPPKKLIEQASIVPHPLAVSRARNGSG